MKRILLFALPLIAMCFASCEKNNGNELSGDDVIEFKDPRFLMSLLNDNYVDFNGDRQITVSEARTVERIILNGHDIEDISEIKYFTALRYLYCGETSLTSLDVSHNLVLDSLYCAGAQISSLDVSKNTNLTYLACGCGPLASLDVSHNTALKVLSISESPIRSIAIDLSQNADLEILGCVNTLLTSLDVTRNTSLKWLQCWDTQITSLDLSKNKELIEFHPAEDDENPSPLESLILYKYHNLSDYSLEILEKYYPNLEISYVE